MSSDDKKEPALEDMREAVAKLAKARKVKAEPLAPPEAKADAPVKAAKVEPDQERLADAMRRAEAVLFASDEPVDAVTLTEALPPGVEAGDVLLRLKAAYSAKGVQLVEVAGKWRFQTAPDLAFLFEETREQPKALSRAALETLAIIAYCQPVTRAEIEEIRGVSVSSGTLDLLIELGWVKLGRRRMSPGRPTTFVVTLGFLDHFGLETEGDLPGLAELRAAGLLDNRPNPDALPEARDEGDDDPDASQGALL